MYQNILRSVFKQPLILAILCSKPTSIQIDMYETSTKTDLETDMHVPAQPQQY